MGEEAELEMHRRRWVAHRSRVKREAGKRAKRDLKEARRLWAILRPHVAETNVFAVDGNNLIALDKLLTEDE